MRQSRHVAPSTMTARARPGGRWRGLGAVGHPFAIAALVLLVANDVALKRVVPGVVTGKLSDVAGLVVFALVVAAGLAVVDPDDDRVLATTTILVGTWFTLMKTIPAVTAATEALATLVAPRAHIVTDPTDLLVLPALAIAWWTWRHRLGPHAWAIPVVVLAATWSLATSCAQETGAQDVAVEADGSFVVSTDYRHTAVVDAQGQVFSRMDGEPSEDEDRDDTDRVCLDDGTCILLDGDDVVEVGPDDATRVAVDIPADRIAFATWTGTTGGGCGGIEPAQDVATNDLGAAVVAHGSHGVSVRTVDGTWTRYALDDSTEFSSSTPNAKVVTGILAAVLTGLLVALWPRSIWNAAGSLGAIVVGVATVLFILPGDELLAFAGLFGVPVVTVLALVVVAISVRRIPWAATRRVLGAMVALLVVTEFVGWVWVTGWIAHMSLAVAVNAVAIAATTVGLVVMGVQDGSWPVPRKVVVPPAPDLSRSDGSAAGT